LVEEVEEEIVDCLLFRLRKEIPTRSPSFNSTLRLVVIVAVMDTILLIVLIIFYILIFLLHTF